MANLTTIVLSASGAVTSSGSFSTLDNTFGTAGTSNANVASVQGVSGGTPLIATGTLAISGTSNVLISGTTNVAVVSAVTTATQNVALVSSIVQGVTLSGTSNSVSVSGTVPVSGTVTLSGSSVTVTGTANVAVQNVVTVTGTVTSSVSISTVSLSGTSNNVSLSGGSVTVSGTTNVSVVNANPNGQATSASSAPVVVASDQSSIGVLTKTATTGGLSQSVLVSASGLNGTVVKSTQGTLYGIQVYNSSASIGYLKFFNASSAPSSSTITATTQVPVKTVMIPSGTAGAGAVYALGLPGVGFSTGIVYVLTGGIANSDTSGVAATTMVINVDYA